MIAIDIGNSSVKTGYFKNNKLIVKRYESIENISELEDNKIIISSVNPKIKKAIIKKIIGEYIEIDSLKIKEIIFKYDDLRALGQDRIASVYGAYKIYGNGSLIVDFGTAITIDFVSSENGYEGGIIFPGPLTIIKCLKNETALLGEHNYRVIENPGLSTRDCINSGITNAIIGMIERIIEMKKDKIKNIIFTGGYGREFLRYFKKAKFEENLVIKGLIEYGKKYYR